MKRLTLAAHYDSLFRPEGFIGAVDSAAPCAILMAVARAVDGALGRRWEGVIAAKEKREGGGERDDGDGLEDEEGGEEEEEEKGVQIVLFDGEEAWERWTNTDSTYGSRYVVTTTVMGWMSSSAVLMMKSLESVLINILFFPAEHWPKPGNRLHTRTHQPTLTG